MFSYYILYSYYSLYNKNYLNVLLYNWWSTTTKKFPDLYKSFKKPHGHWICSLIKKYWGYPYDFLRLVSNIVHGTKFTIANGRLTGVACGCIYIFLDVIKWHSTNTIIYVLACTLLYSSEQVRADLLFKYLKWSSQKAFQNCASAIFTTFSFLSQLKKKKLSLNMGKLFNDYFRSIFEQCNTINIMHKYNAP